MAEIEIRQALPGAADQTFGWLLLQNCLSSAVIKQDVCYEQLSPSHSTASQLGLETLGTGPLHQKMIFLYLQSVCITVILMSRLKEWKNSFFPQWCGNVHTQKPQVMMLPLQHFSLHILDVFMLVMKFLFFIPNISQWYCGESNWSTSVVCLRFFFFRCLWLDSVIHVTTHHGFRTIDSWTQMLTTAMIHLSPCCCYSEVLCYVIDHAPTCGIGVLPAGRPLLGGVTT